MKSIVCSDLTESFGMRSLTDEELVSINGGVSESVGIAIIGAVAVVGAAIITAQCSQPQPPCSGVYCSGGYNPSYSFGSGSRC